MAFDREKDSNLLNILRGDRIDDNPYAPFSKWQKCCYFLFFAFLPFSSLLFFPFYFFIFPFCVHSSLFFAVFWLIFIGSAGYMSYVLLTEKPKEEKKPTKRLRRRKKKKNNEEETKKEGQDPE